MKRNLRFWSRYTWESTYTELGAVAIPALFTAVGAEGLDWSLFASVIPYYLIISSMICMILINYSSHLVYVPLLISMGETRRNIFYGFHYYRSLIITVTIALSALIWVLVPGEVSAIGLSSIPTILVVLVIASALGSLMGTAYAKWKWISVLVIMGIAGGVGGVAGYTFLDRIKLEQAATVELASLLQKLPWWLVLAASVLLAIDVCFHWALLRRQEVKL